MWFISGDEVPGIYTKAKAAGKVNELPVNHSPKFAPSAVHPTLETGVEALVVGASRGSLPPDLVRSPTRLRVRSFAGAGLTVDRSRSTRMTSTS